MQAANPNGRVLNTKGHQANGWSNDSSVTYIIFKGQQKAVRFTLFSERHDGGRRVNHLFQEVSPFQNYKEAQTSSPMDQVAVRSNPNMPSSPKPPRWRYTWQRASVYTTAGEGVYQPFSDHQSHIPAYTQHGRATKCPPNLLLRLGA